MNLKDLSEQELRKESKKRLIYVAMLLVDAAGDLDGNYSHIIEDFEYVINYVPGVINCINELKERMGYYDRKNGLL